GSSWSALDIFRCPPTGYTPGHNRHGPQWRRRSASPLILNPNGHFQPRKSGAGAELNGPLGSHESTPRRTVGSCELGTSDIKPPIPSGLIFVLVSFPASPPL